MKFRKDPTSFKATNKILASIPTSSLRQPQEVGNVFGTESLVLQETRN